jgi:uncharacterized membrane protein
MNRLPRILRHLFETRFVTRRRFTAEVLDAIEAAVRTAEETHAGEVRFVVETDLDTVSILGGKTPRQRAIEIFAGLRVWDTELNNGVLVYVLCADRAVEIIADRGFNGLVTDSEWAAVCRAMEGEFRAGRWRHGAVAGVAGAAALLRHHFPGSHQVGNELPDRPVLL